MAVPASVFSHRVGLDILHNVIVSLGFEGCNTALYEEHGVAVTLQDVLLADYATARSDDHACALQLSELLRSSKQGGTQRWCWSRYRDDPALPDVCEMLVAPDFEPFVVGPRGGRRQLAAHVAHNLAAAETRMLQLLTGEARVSAWPTDAAPVSPTYACAACMRAWEWGQPAPAL